MALEFVLQREIQPGIWDAKGAFAAHNGMKGEVDILVKKVDDNSVKLHLDSNIKVSKINNREVLYYTNAKPEVATPGVVANAKVKVVNNLWFNLKK